jgi:hypothetical protein
MGTEGWGESRLTRRPIRSRFCANESTAMRAIGSSLRHCQRLQFPIKTATLSLFPLLRHLMYSHPNPPYVLPWHRGPTSINPWTDFLFLPCPPSHSRTSSKATRHKWPCYPAVTRTDDCREHHPRTQAAALKTNVLISELPYFHARCRTKNFRS